MFEMKESNSYEERELTRHEIYRNVDDYQNQLPDESIQSGRRLFVRQETQNDFHSKPERSHDELVKSILDMYTTGTIYENTQLHPYSEKQLNEELNDSNNKCRNVFSEYENWKMVNKIPSTFDPSWRASLSSETVQNKQKVLTIRGNKLENSNSGSKYSKESIKQLQLSIQKQQQQMVAHIMKTQKAAQDEMSKTFEKLSTLISEKTPEKITKTVQMEV